jgi:phosphoglycolate phosphatase-like HAD superfamily hydrolase
MYKYIIWDFDGTLFNTYPTISKSFRDLLKQYNIDASLVEINSKMRISMPTAYQYYLNKYNLEQNFVSLYLKQLRERELSITKP